MKRWPTPRSTRDMSFLSSCTPKTCVRIFLVLALAALIIGECYYAVGSLSARSLVIRTQTVSERYQRSPLGYAEVDITVNVMDSGPYGLNLSRVTFGLTLDNTTFPSVQASGSTFSAGQSPNYTIRFVSNDGREANYFSQAKNQTVTVSMTAWVSSGMYSGWVTASDSRIWTFQFYYTDH